MAAIPTEDGRMIWYGRISVASTREAVKKASLRTGQMVLDNSTNTLQIIFETTFDQEILEPFHINDVHSVSEHLDNKTACIFQESNSSSYIIFDFKDVRVINEHPLNPEQRANSLIRFLRDYPQFLATNTNDEVQSEKDNEIIQQTAPKPLTDSKHEAVKRFSDGLQDASNPLDTADSQALTPLDVEPKALESDNSANPESLSDAELPQPSNKPDDPKTISDTKPEVPKLPSDATPTSSVQLKSFKPIIPTRFSYKDSLFSNFNLEGCIAHRKGKRAAASMISFAVPKRVKNRGFPNDGNDCYSNVALQALCNTVAFKEAVLALREYLQKQCNATDEHLQRMMPLSTNLSELFREFVFESKGDLERIQQEVKKAMDKFSSNDQEDAHEFLTFLLDCLKKEYETAKAAVTDVQLKKTFPPEPVHACFGHTIQREFTCQKCAKSNIRADEETFFIVDIGVKKDNVGLSNIIQGSLREEIVDRRCSNKKCKGDKALVMSFLSQTPKVFIVVIRRYEFNSAGQSKRKDKITMEETLKIFREPPLDGPPHYSVDCSDEDYLMQRNFRILRTTFNGRGLKRSNFDYKQVEDTNDLHSSYVRFLLALTNRKTSFVKFVEQNLCQVLSDNAEVFAPLMNKTVEVFKRHIRNCRFGGSVPTTIDLLACAALFKTNFWAFDGKRYVKFPPLTCHVIAPGDIFISEHVHIDYTEFNNHSINYSLNSIVCHRGDRSEKGHYDGFIHSPNSGGVWLKCDDSSVIVRSTQSVMKCGAELGYIMHYTRNDV